VRRWNGWGSDRVDFPITASAKAYLVRIVGSAQPRPSARYEDVLKSVPRAEIPAHPLISRDPGLRLKHAHGQSLLDWIALRSGAVGRVPDAVGFPSTEKEVEELLVFARKTGAAVIPFGGGTSVVGHINPVGGACPVLTIDMSRMFRLTSLDEESHLATFGAGVTGPHLEAQLRARGFTLGHFPQSFEYSTLGGWIATRSSGQQSLLYGRIEDLFAGGTIISPQGRLELPPFPASAAGPDLRQILLGSEGRLGIITQATMRLTVLAERERFHGIFFPDWDHGISALKKMVQDSVPLSMLRLTDSEETGTTLALAGHERLIRLLERLLRARGVEEGKCLLLVGLTGGTDAVRKARRQTLDIAQAHKGVYVGRRMGSEWRRSRFRTPYLRNTLWDLGYAVDTLESAFIWKDVSAAAEAILRGLRNGLEDDGEKVHAFAHISRVYSTGASLYFTYIFRMAADPGETLARWHKLKKAASLAILAGAGTISHQHGVGTDHLPYVEQEKGSLGLQALRALANTLDPHGIMNPGKLLPPLEGN
jgi:alkyldihydroxyacetonephosphate synthase